MTETREKSKERIGVRGVVQIGMLSAIAIILMQFEVPLPFAPPFYKIDFSEIPVLIGCFVMGPLAGAIVELIKVILNVVISGTTTGGVGDIANFLIGCAMCVPAGMIYKKLSYEKECTCGNGSRNRIYDGDRVYFECICAASGIRKSIRDANRCVGRDGNSCEPLDYKSFYVCDFCSSSV